MCAGDTGCVTQTRVYRGNSEHMVGPVRNGGSSVSCMVGPSGVEPWGVLLWPEGFLGSIGRPNGPAVPHPFTATEGPRRSLPLLSYLLCWVCLLSLLLTLLALSVNCSKVNLENKDKM